MNRAARRASAARARAEKRWQRRREIPRDAIETIAKRFVVDLMEKGTDPRDGCIVVLDGEGGIGRSLYRDYLAWDGIDPDWADGYKRERVTAQTGAADGTGAIVLFASPDGARMLLDRLEPQREGDTEYHDELVRLVSGRGAPGVVRVLTFVNNTVGLQAVSTCEHPPTEIADELWSERHEEVRRQAQGFFLGQWDGGYDRVMLVMPNGEGGIMGVFDAREKIADGIVAMAEDVANAIGLDDGEKAHMVTAHRRVSDELRLGPINGIVQMVVLAMGGASLFVHDAAKMREVALESRNAAGGVS